MTTKQRENIRLSIDLPPTFFDQLEIPEGSNRKKVVEAIIKSPRHELTPYELVALDLIDPNPYQPRQKFNKEKMAQLLMSILANGLINPATGRRLENGRVQLATGERRLRVFKELAEMRDGFDRLPVIISEMTDKQMARTAAAENTDRDDVSPIEKARAILELVASGTAENQQEAGSWYNYKKSAASELVALLTLPDEIVIFIDEYNLTPSHGRHLRRAAAAIGKEQLHLIVELARETIRKEWDVSDLKTEVDKFITAHQTPPPTLPMMKLSPAQVDEAVAKTIAPPSQTAPAPTTAPPAKEPEPPPTPPAPELKPADLKPAPMVTPPAEPEPPTTAPEPATEPPAEINMEDLEDELTAAEYEMLKRVLKVLDVGLTPPLYKEIRQRILEDLAQ